MNFSLKNLCTPANIYFWLSILGIAVMALSKFALITTAINIIFVLLWTWFLNYLCSKGYSGVSWVFVLLPLVLVALAVINFNKNIFIFKK